MHYRPIFVVYFCISRYLTEEQLISIRKDFAKNKRHSKKIFLAAIAKQMDISILLMKPMIPQDAWIYNYLKYDIENRWQPGWLVSNYEKQVVMPLSDDFINVVLETPELGLPFSKR